MPSIILEQSYIPFQCMIINNVCKFQIEDISNTQYCILELLALEGDRTAKELSEIRGISQSGISKLVRRLLEKGYIQQSRSTEDRRFYILSITKEGRDFLDRAGNFRSEMLNTIEKALTAEEVIQFSELCQKIIRMPK